MKNNQKGITLVALVITIIVLLILAGVTIASLSGDNGLMTKGVKARNENAVQTEIETIKTSFNVAMADWYDAKYVANDYDDKSAVKYIVDAMNADEDFKAVAEFTGDTESTSLSKATIELKGQFVRDASQNPTTKKYTFQIDAKGNAATLTDVTEYETGD